MAIAEMPTKIDQKEIEMEETKLRIKALANDAAQDLDRLRESQKGATTANVAELASWLDQDAGKNEESLKMVVDALKEAHFWMDDEKKVNINAKINDVVAMMRDFTSRPDWFRTQNDSNLNRLQTFCEALANR